MSDAKEPKSERSPAPGFYWVRHDLGDDWDVGRVCSEPAVDGSAPSVRLADGGLPLAMRGFEFGPRIEPPVTWAIQERPTGPNSDAERAKVAHRAETLRDLARPSGGVGGNPGGHVATLTVTSVSQPAMPEGYRAAPVRLTDHVINDAGGGMATFPNANAAASLCRALVAWAEQQKAGGRCDRS